MPIKGFLMFRTALITNHRCSKPSEPLTGLTFSYLVAMYSERKINLEQVRNIFFHRKVRHHRYNTIFPGVKAPKGITGNV